MRKLQISDVGIMRIAIKQEISRSEEARYDHRLHGVLLLSHGLSCYKVAELLGQHPTTIERWAHRFEKHGFAGLQDQEHPGRFKRLNPEQWIKLGKDLRESPRQLGYEQNLWDGKLLAHHLAQSYRVKLGVRQCQRIFRQMGFRRRKPRPVIAKSDPAAQEAFKKTPWISRKR